MIDVETHRKVFLWVLGVIADRGLLKGKTVGVDATTLEANAAMRSIVRRDDGARYDEFLQDLAKQSGIEPPSREDLARMDRKRKKKGCNEEWESPSDPDVRIAKILRFGKTRTNVGLDIYNVTNSSTTLTYNNTYGTTWLTPQTFMPARFVKITGQFNF